MSGVPPSWEVLDEEAQALGLEVSYEVDSAGQGYVVYTGNGWKHTFSDHPIGRQCANEKFEKLASE